MSGAAIEKAFAGNLHHTLFTAPRVQREHLFGATVEDTAAAAEASLQLCPDTVRPCEAVDRAPRQWKEHQSHQWI